MKRAVQQGTYLPDALHAADLTGISDSQLDMLLNKTNFASEQVEEIRNAVAAAQETTALSISSGKFVY